MRNQEWDPAFAKLHPLDLSQLVFCLVAGDTVDGEAALCVVYETEVFVGLVNGYDVHVAGRIGGISADFLVDLDKTLHKDGFGFAVVESIFETVPQKDNERHAVTVLVWTGRCARSICTGELVQEPVRRRTETFLMLLSVERYDQRQILKSYATRIYVRSSTHDCVVAVEECGV